MWKKVQTPSSCVKHTGVFCVGLSVPGKARRRGVGVELRNRAQELVIWGLGGHRGSYQNDPLWGFGLNNMFVTKECNTRKYCDLWQASLVQE